MTSNEEIRLHMRKLARLVARMREFQMEVNNTLRETDEAFESLPDEQKIDTLWCVREMERTFDELRKESKARTVRHGEPLAMQWIRESIEEGFDADEEKRVKGFFASGSPAGRTSASTVKIGQPGYKELCEHFGVPSELTEKDTFNFKYDGLGKLLTGLAEAGVDISRLPGIKKTYTQFSMSIRTLRNQKALGAYEDE